MCRFYVCVKQYLIVCMQNNRYFFTHKKRALYVYTPAPRPRPRPIPIPIPIPTPTPTPTPALTL